MRYLGVGQPLSRHESWRSLAFFVGHWQLCGFGVWAVLDNATACFVGRIDFHQAVEWPGFEIDWLIDRRFLGQGFATGSAQAILSLAIPNYNRTPIVSLILRSGLPKRSMKHSKAKPNFTVKESLFTVSNYTNSTQSR